MYRRERRKMKVLIIISIATLATAESNNTDNTINKNGIDDNFDNNIIDFDEDYSVKFNKNYGVSWKSDEGFNKESHRYTVFKDDVSNNDKETRFKNKVNRTHKEDADKENVTEDKVEDTTTSSNDYSSIPAELLSTTVDPLVSIIESTIEPDLSVIPLTTKRPRIPEVVINQTVTLPPSTQIPDTTPDMFSMTTDDDIQSTTVSEVIDSVNNTHEVMKGNENPVTFITTTGILPSTVETTTAFEEVKIENITSDTVIDKIIDSKVLNISIENTKTLMNLTNDDVYNNKAMKGGFNTSDELQDNNATDAVIFKKNKLEEINYETNSSTEARNNDTKSITTNHTSNANDTNKNMTAENAKDRNATTVTPKANKARNNQTNLVQSKTKNGTLKDSSEDVEVPVFTGLDTEEETEVPEDYYDSKDVVPTPAPKTDALSVIFGLAGSVVESVVESVAERVVPKGIVDLFKRMQKQNEALEAERLRSREENGGLGQFGRGLLKSISSGLSRPLTQLMAARDIGSLDTDRGFVTSVSTSVASAATTLADAFKDRVQAIYPGTVWCGDGHAASARSGELGLFFFTDTCCRQHDACRLYIRAGETKYGLTNTGLFTRSHCSCDLAFRDCLRRTNSLVSAQIGLTYFNVLGPQCFRKAHPIVRCVRRTRITGQKCEEYELDYTKPKMWQWFDNETF